FATDGTGGFSLPPPPPHPAADSESENTAARSGNFAILANACRAVRSGVARLGRKAITMTSLSEEHGLCAPRKLHSIAGVMPLLAFVVLHLWINARAMQGRASYDRLVTKLS